MRALVLIVCVFLAGCASTPTVEQVNASRAKWATGCQARGYKPGTQDFQTCLDLAAQAELQKPVQDQAALGAGLGAAWIGLSALALSDVRAKRDIEQLATLDSGIHLYRFRYLGSDQLYVGVIAQDVQRVMPQAVVKGADGLLRVHYDLVGVKLTTWEQWNAAETAF